MAAFQRKLCIDFDGVLHLYKSGWQGHGIVSDGPVEDLETGRSSIQWISELVHYKDEDGDPAFEVMIYSSRSRYDEGIEAMKEWLLRHGLPYEDLQLISFPTQKPSAWMTIDDRAFCFQGIFPTPQFLMDFKPWNKK